MTQFSARPAIDPATGTLVISAIGHVYAVTDTSFATPLSVTDLQGVPMTDIRTTTIGTMPDFVVGTDAGPFQVVWKSGPWAFIIDSPAGIMASAAASASSSALSAADAVVARAAAVDALSRMGTKVLVLAAAAPIPAGTADGTLIVRYN